MAKEPDNYSEKEAQERFETALKSALKTPHKPLKEKPKVKKAKKKARSFGGFSSRDLMPTSQKELCDFMRRWCRESKLHHRRMGSGVSLSG